MVSLLCSQYVRTIFLLTIYILDLSSIRIVADLAQNDMCWGSHQQSATLLPSSHSITCSPGHWPLRKTCSVHGSELWYDIESGAFGTYGNNKLPADIMSVWNISVGVSSPSKCSFTVRKSIFMPIAFDKKSYQSDGSNYYVTHVDAAIPLWSYLRSHAGNTDTIDPPVIAGFAFNVFGEISFVTDAFSIPDKYWVRSLQILVDRHLLLPGTKEGWTAYAQRSLRGYNHPFHPFSAVSEEVSTGHGAVICFQDVRFGLPLLDLPSPISVRRFASEYRQKALAGSNLDSSPLTPTPGVAGDSAVRALCVSQVKRVGVLIRQGRRRIHNENEFLAIVQRAGRQWCDSFVPSVGGEAKDCEVVVERLYFGGTGETSSGFSSLGGGVELDIYSIQGLAVMVGLQGSGMINALYLPPVSAALAVYLNDGWPIANGDPLALIGHRGPYIRHVNTNASKVLCGLQSDQYCDSGDMILDEDTFSPLIVKALQAHQAACEGLLTSQ